MSIKHLEQAGDMEGLDPAKKLVLMALCDDASKDTRVAYPGMEKLRRWSGRSERRVSQVIEELIRDGYLARAAFARPGRKAEFIVFPTDAELAELDGVDERLNESRKRPPRKRKDRQPVDNSTGMGATGFSHSETNVGNIAPNAGNPGCRPPVSTPLNTSTGPVPEVTTEGSVDKSGTGPRITPATVSKTHGHPFAPADVFASLGKALPSTFDDDQLRTLAAEILAEAATPVIDPTGYVIRTLRNSAKPGERRRGRWWLRADEIAVEHLELTLRGGVRF